MAYNYGNYTGMNYGIGGINYSPNYGQNQIPMQNNYQQQMQQRSGNVILDWNWAQGVGMVASTYIPPGSKALFMESGDNQRIYIKAVDLSGRPQPIEAYELVKIENIVDQPYGNDGSSNAPDMSEYVKRSDLEAMVSEAVTKAVNEALK